MRKAFRLTIESPYGKQPVEQFRHFIKKVSDESLERWGIEITLTEVADNEQEVTKDDFN